MRGRETLSVSCAGAITGTPRAPAQTTSVLADEPAHRTFDGGRIASHIETLGATRTGPGASLV